MALSAAQLATLRRKAKLYVGIDDDDGEYHADALAVYSNASGATTATVEVTATTMVLVITGGPDAGTNTLTFADSDKDTVGELVTAISALSGWVATLLGSSEAASTDLVRRPPTDALRASGDDTEIILTVESTELLDLIINGAYEGLESYLCRSLYAADYTEVVQIDYQTAELVLSQPDVIYVDRVAMDDEAAMDVQYDSTALQARVQVTSTGVDCLTDGGTVTRDSIAFTDQGTMTLMAAAITALSGWDATALVAAPSRLLVREGPQDVKDQTFTLSYWYDWQTEYTVDFDAGTIDLGVVAAPPKRGCYVEYRAGFETLPADIEGVILSMVKAEWDQKTQQTAGVIAERLGDYSYQLGSSSAGGASATFSEYSHILRKYARWLP